MAEDPAKELESHFNAHTLNELINSGYRMITERGVHEGQRGIVTIYERLVYFLLIVVPAVGLRTYQNVRHAVTGDPKGHPEGSWQWALKFSLREDLAHHTVETIGYHEDRPDRATEVDDLSAWVMTLIQFLWSYEDLMGVVWDEWTLVRLVDEAAAKLGLQSTPLFRRLTRQWEIHRPYNAPFNGTYADVRRGALDEFIQPRLDQLPDDVRQGVLTRFSQLRGTERRQYQQQMSLLYSIVPGTFEDKKSEIPLWDAAIALIIGGRYYLIPLAVHNNDGYPSVYGTDGSQWPLHVKDGVPYSPEGDELRLVEDRLIRVSDGEQVGYLDVAPFSAIKAQVAHILNEHAQNTTDDYDQMDILLAETPRVQQGRLRSLLSGNTREQLKALQNVPIIINWDGTELETNATLAGLRRVQRGIGDHALTVIRTPHSFIFDQHHIFFDGVWSLAMAEVLTNSAVAWCERGLSIAPSPAPRPYALELHASAAFLREAGKAQNLPEISAETKIHDITTLLGLRKRIKAAGAALTVNDLLVTGRLFHAANYKPSTRALEAIDEFRRGVRTRAERQAVHAIEESIEQGRVISPSLAIPVDASPTDPKQRIFLLTFRDTKTDIVQMWNDTWDAYQAYRRIEPPNTPEGFAAYRKFERLRVNLIATLRELSFLLDASKSVAIRGDSFAENVFNLLAHLPPGMQNVLRLIPEQFEFLNEITRGNEIYSNIGRVAGGSSLSRFITAKDDGKAKHLAWGIMTDDHGNMVVTMRDFRPHVAPLVRVGRIDLAQMLAQDYVEAYTNDLLGLVARMTAMLLVSEPAELD